MASDAADWPRDALRQGISINGYKIDAVIGRGGFGITYRATDALDQVFAIKECFPRQFALRENDLVLPAGRSDAEALDDCRQRFSREARALLRLSADGRADGTIVGVITFFEANGTAYIVMEFVSGQSLDDLIKGSPGGIPAETLIALLDRLMTALSAVHAADILHRDIKPSNILLRDGAPVLIDFGAVRVSGGNQTVTFTQIYSESYAPIEQFTGAVQGPFSDIYALGATLYRAIGGKTVDAMTRHHALLRQAPDPQRPAAQIGAGRYPEWLLRTIDAALAVDPANRPQSIAALWHLAHSGHSGPATAILSEADHTKRAEPAARVEIAVPVPASPPPIMDRAPVPATRPVPPLHIAITDRIAKLCIVPWWIGAICSCLISGALLAWREWNLQEGNFDLDDRYSGYIGAIVILAPGFISLFVSFWTSHSIIKSILYSVLVGMVPFAIAILSFDCVMWNILAEYRRVALYSACGRTLAGVFVDSDPLVPEVLMAASTGAGFLLHHGLVIVSRRYREPRGTVAMAGAADILAGNPASPTAFSIMTWVTNLCVVPWWLGYLCSCVVTTISLVLLKELPWSLHRYSPLIVVTLLFGPGGFAFFLKPWARQSVLKSGTHAIAATALPWVVMTILTRCIDWSWVIEHWSFEIYGSCGDEFADLLVGPFPLVPEALMAASSAAGLLIHYGLIFGSRRFHGTYMAK